MRILKSLKSPACVAAVLGVATASAQPSTADAPPLPTRPAQPLWEAGLVAGSGRVSDYPGADQTHLRSLVVPIFIYRGSVLRVEQGGIRGRFVNTPDWEFDLAASAAFNAQNNTARAGMPALDYLFGVGPQWIYKGLQTPAGGPALHLKFRSLVSTNLKHFDSRGFSFDPELRWRFAGVAGSASALTLSLQPTWASAPLQRYFYQVEPGEATPTRPAYQARAGYLGSQVSATLGGRVPGVSEAGWFVTAQVMSLHGAANQASPLLRDKTNASIGVGVAWTPWRSAATAGD